MCSIEALLWRLRVAQTWLCACEYFFLAAKRQFVHNCWNINNVSSLCGSTQTNYSLPCQQRWPHLTNRERTLFSSTPLTKPRGTFQEFRGSEKTTKGLRLQRDCPGFSTSDISAMQTGPPFSAPVFFPFFQPFCVLKWLWLKNKNRPFLSLRLIWNIQHENKIKNIYVLCIKTIHSVDNVMIRWYFAKNLKRRATVLQVYISGRPDRSQTAQPEHAERPEPPHCL